MSDHNAVVATLNGAKNMDNESKKYARSPLVNIPENIISINEEKQAENEFRINNKMSLNRLLNNTIEFIKKDENNILSLSGLGNAI